MQVVTVRHSGTVQQTPAQSASTDSCSPHFQAAAAAEHRGKGRFESQKRKKEAEPETRTEPAGSCWFLPVPAGTHVCASSSVGLLTCRSSDTSAATPLSN